MFTIKRLQDQVWEAEIIYKTELKAFINARTKDNAYHVINRDRAVAYIITLDDYKERFRANCGYNIYLSPCKKTKSPKPDHITHFSRRRTISLSGPRH